MFNSDMTVKDWTDSLTSAKRHIKNAIDEANARADQWDDMTQGLSVSGIMQISQFGGRTFDDVRKIDRGFKNLQNIYDVVNGNIAVSSPTNYIALLDAFQ